MTGLAELRARIDALDASIVSAFAERLDLSRRTVVHKGGRVRDEEREAEVLARVAEAAAKAGLEPRHAHELYAVVLRISRELQSPASPGGDVLHRDVRASTLVITEASDSRR